MIIMPGDEVTHATVIDADVACGAGDSEVEITEVADTEVAVSRCAIEPSDATTARSRPPTHAGTKVRHISVRMFEWLPPLAPPRSRSAAVM